MEVSWRDPELVALRAERQAELSSRLRVGTRLSLAGMLAGMEGGGVAAARGAGGLRE